MNRKNRTLVAILLVLTISLIGLTIAYFSNSTTIDNEFKTKEYGTTYTEEFVSPDNWLPGDTTDKTVIVTNSGQVDEAVRISLTESWTPNNTNATLTGWIHADGTKSNHTTEEELSTDERAAVINFTDNSDWTKVGDYYYYNYKLAPNETTDSLIESVTFNALTKLGDTCIPSTSNGVTTIITCNSSGEDYDNATYKLTVNIETVQYNKYQEIWGTEFAIAEEKFQEVSFAQHIISKSNNATVTNYTDGITTEAYTFNHEATDQTPALTDYRYIGASPNNYVEFNCDENGENCEIWRAIGVFNVENKFGHYEQKVKLVRGSSISGYHSWDTEHNDWTNSSIETFLNNDYLYRIGDASDYGLKKSAQDMIDETKYYLGALNKLDFSPKYGSAEYLYIQERGSNTCGTCNGDISKLNWIGKVGIMYPSDEYMAYVNGVDDGCFDSPENCYFNDIVSTASDIEEVHGHPETGWIYNSNTFKAQSEPQEIWLLSTDSEMTNVQFTVAENGKLSSGFGGRVMRPVVYLKSSIQVAEGDGSINNPYILAGYSSYSDTITNDYTVGSTISYQNNDYCVINNDNSEYITLIKSQPLTYDELVTYNNGYIIGRSDIDSDIGITNFFANENCRGSYNVGCSANYDISNIRNILNNWSTSINDDLETVNGYKVRLITSDELNDMGHVFYLGTAHAQIRQRSEFECLYSNVDYWTMSNTGDSTLSIDVVSMIDNHNTSEGVWEKYAVRPVINLKKCALTNTCE